MDTRFRLLIPSHGDVTAAADAPPDGASPRFALTLAHGAGAPMDHPFMQAAGSGLAQRGVGVLRFNFPYAERGSSRVDAPAVAQAAIRAAAEATALRWPDAIRLAGGKSFGGRMTSQAQAAEPLPGVLGLVFLGFPLHAAGKPSIDRAAHLADIAAPMLFVQGTRDALAERERMAGVVARLGARADLLWVDDADHGFHVRKSSGRSDAQALDAALDEVAAWMARQARAR